MDDVEKFAYDKLKEYQMLTNDINTKMEELVKLEQDRDALFQTTLLPILSMEG